MVMHESSFVGGLSAGPGEKALVVVTEQIPVT